MARKVRKVPKDKDSGLPKRYFTGLKGSRRSRRASLIKKVSSIYKSGGVIPRSLLKARTKA